MSKPEQSVDAVTASTARRRRGKWTAEQRRRIVADSRVAGASVQEVAQRHGVRANLLTAWRRQAAASRMAKPVKFAAVKLSVAPADGSIEIDLAAGCVRVRGIVDGTMLREVLRQRDDRRAVRGEDLVGLRGHRYAARL